MSTFFVTGGAGFIGQAFVRAAVAAGHGCDVYDKARGDDLANGTLLNTSMKLCKPDWVVHMAATPGVSNGKDSGGAEACNDVFNTCQVLRAMNASGCKRIMFLSTGSCYGDSGDFLVSEDYSDARQVGFYAAGKLAAEKFLEAQHAAQGTEVAILRLGTVIGPGNAKGFIKDFVRKLKADPTKLEVLGDGWQVKSYIHIDDMVSAMLSVIGWHKRIDTYNVSLGTGRSIRQLQPVISRAMKVDPEVVYGESKQGFFGDIPHIELDNKRLRMTGWKPKHTIEEAVRANVLWLLDHPEVFG